MSVTRLYEVQTTIPSSAAQTYLVEATSQAAAWRYVAEKYVAKPTLPTGKEIAVLMSKGVKVEEAKGDE